MTNITEVKELTHYIDGKMIAGKSGRFQEVFNPATGEVIANVPLASVEEVKYAIKKAEAAFPAWRDLSVAKRAEIVMAFRNLLIENKDKVIELICTESGKTEEDALGEITRGIESVDLAINAPHLMKGEYSVNVGGQINAYSAKYPLGVVAAISPFNFPIMVPLAQTCMAVAVGNAVILKASERVPMTALYISELWTKAGLPDGIWTVINGDKEAVNELLENPAVQAISFVGSTPVARYIYETSAKYGKRVVALGGGKNNMVVMPDADLEQVANAFISAGYGAASQRCMAISTLMPVGQETADRLVEILEEKINRLKVGAYTQGADYGPVISQQAKETILKAIDRSEQEGAKIVCDGRNKDITKNSKGFFLAPTLLDYVKPGMEIYDEEVFGPVRNIVRVDSLEEAIKLINQHELGNGVTIFTNNGLAARKFTTEIDVGMVGVNVPIPIPVGYHNFAGFKGSKFGDGQMFGPDQARFYTKTKMISERWLTPSENSSLSFAFPSNK
ncbi:MULTISPECIES: CoA-acylating methylmalonate-semialdehyde dehydrogenase [unclassified Bacillus (in: firmicutes)]|uniref:CoA-acylating methylmalonate-semialdehyde dehydrogenase n=1 Tax=unclassified Bacillus (in: firmicutes) TaxID=185979 RepID=UPI0008E1E9DD|nr:MULTISPECIES: CoA-acylating methylmalonate-semialdehyde dehydrogenase [unclassified Bacillus (in: firmicutes)]PGZ91656.1 methylmalonate-semialdehyde dehydrogenase (CoA acylating) [Bacillus sp. AFS029533]SFD11264.1 malonate-semialdehyde dehydrogenase (acetylating) / methylmalonate-semialdehyde dehydrogenase [Bacillus sp. UNCCL81]